MAAQKITLKIKITTCKICKNADQRALRKRLPFCQAKNPRNKNGHCTEFESLKPRKKAKAEMEVLA